MEARVRGRHRWNCAGRATEQARGRTSCRPAFTGPRGSPASATVGPGPSGDDSGSLRGGTANGATRLGPNGRISAFGKSDFLRGWRSESGINSAAAAAATAAAAAATAAATAAAAAAAAAAATATAATGAAAAEHLYAL